MRDLITEIKNYPIGMTKDLIDMMGKLNKYYWIRGDKEDTRQSNEDRYYELIRGRNASGY